jgi:hypothetical protein
MLWLLTGPSCSGKSTLAYGAQRTAVTGAPAGARVEFPATFDPAGLSIGDDVVYHYNILRTADAARSCGLHRRPQDDVDFRSDPPWERLRTLRHPKRAVVLVATRQTLLARMTARDAVEPCLDDEGPRHPRAHWQAIASAVDLNLVYRSWCDELLANGIELTLVDSGDFAYRPISLADLTRSDLDACEATVGGAARGPSPAPRAAAGRSR